MGIPPFKMPTPNKETLWAEDSMRDGYRPKMLLYALDKLFYVYTQVKNSQRPDKKLVLAYEILCISANCCTDQHNRIEKTGVPDALALLNVEDTHHLECLAWVVYDGILMVGPWPKLLGNRPWCSAGWATATHLQVLRRCGSLPATDTKFLGPSGVGRSTAPCGRPQLHTKWVEMSIPAPEEILKQLMSSLPDAGSGWTFMCHVPPHAFEMSTRSDFTHLCDFKVLLQHCSTAASHDISTTPKVALAVNIPPYAQSSHSGEGTAWASLDQDEALEDDFQTQHTPVHRVMQRDDDGHRSSAEGRLEGSGGGPGQWTGYHVHSVLHNSIF